jgi:HK97 family phage portal protein
MILRTTNGSELEVRDLFTGSDRVPRPGEASGSWAYSGRVVSFESASGLPAVMAAIRLISDTAASLPLRVYLPAADGSMLPATTPEANLLGREPNEQQSAFQVWSFVFGSMLGWGGAYLLKAKSQGKVVGLYPIDPSRVSPRVENGELVFNIRTVANPGIESNKPFSSIEQTRLTSKDVLYIPGQLLNDPYIGVTPIAIHRHALGNALAQQEFAGRYYSNDGSPGGIISVPSSLTKEKREELREAFEARHRGPSAAHRVGILTGGATYDVVPINLRDAAFIESMHAHAQDVARMFGIPAGMLDASDFNHASTPEQDMIRFRLRLTPWLRRVESALETDVDLFPDRDVPGMQDLDPVVRFDANELVRADLAQRFSAYTSARQGGWMSANEIRAQENLPAVDGGDQIQVTPVGGAPNPDAVNATDAAVTDDADETFSTVDMADAASD